MPSTRLIVRGAPLPNTLKGDLNKLWKAMLDRIEVVSPFGELQLQIGGLKPTSNKGLWVKDGQKIYVWDENSKDYIPLDISDSLGPVNTLISTAVAPLATTAAMNAAIAAAIAAIPAPDTVQSAFFAANQTSPLTSGSMNNSDATIDIPWSTVTEDTEDGFEVGKYIVKKAGRYAITFAFHTEVTSGSASNLVILGTLTINGTGVRSMTPGISATGSSIFEINYQAQLQEGDQIAAHVDLSADGGPITVQVSSNNTRLSGFLIPS